MKTKILCLITASVLLLATSIHAQNLLQNGSFENFVNPTDESSLGGSQFNYAWDGTSYLSPANWTGTFGTYSVSGGSQWITIASGNPGSSAGFGAENLAVDPGTPLGPLAQDGSIYLRFDTTATISQTVTTVVGQSYNLSFWVGANGDMPTAPNSLTGSVIAYVNGTSLGTFTETATFRDELDWKQYDETFTATSTSTTIGFGGAVDVDPNNVYEHNGLDNVSLTPDVTATPEPSTLALAGLGGMASFYLFRRRK